MVHYRDLRSAHQKWEQLMAEARHSCRPSLFIHRRPLPEFYESWPTTTKVNRSPCSEEGPNFLSRSDIPHSCHDETEARVTINVTTLMPLSVNVGLNVNHTETRSYTLTRTVKEKSKTRNQAASPIISGTTRPRSDERDAGTYAGPCWREWCAWDEEHLWLRYWNLGHQYQGLAPFGRSCPLIDIGYAKARSALKQRGRTSNEPRAEQAVLRQRFRNFADQLTWRFLARDRHIVTDHRYFINGSYSPNRYEDGYLTHAMETVPSDGWIQRLIEYLYLQEVQDERCAAFLAQDIFDSSGQLRRILAWQKLLAEIYRGAREIENLWHRKPYLEASSTRR